MPKVFRRDEARCDLARTYKLVAAKAGSEAAERLLREIDRKAQLYATHPDMGFRKPWMPEPLRGFMVGRYLVAYERVPEGIALVRVIFASRDLSTEFDL